MANTKKVVKTLVRDFFDPEFQIRVREYDGSDGQKYRQYGSTCEELEDQRRRDAELKALMEDLASPVSSSVQPLRGSGEGGQSTPELPGELESLPKAPEPCPEYGDDGFARTYDPQTSKDAANGVNVKGRQLEFMKALAAMPDGEGITEDVTDRINHMYGRQEIPSNLSPRCKPLRRKGLVVDTGRKKRSRQGELNSIWKLTPEGWSLLKIMGSRDNYL